MKPILDERTFHYYVDTYTKGDGKEYFIHPVTGLEMVHSGKNSPIQINPNDPEDDQFRSALAARTVSYDEVRQKFGTKIK